MTFNDFADRYEAAVTAAPRRSGPGPSEPRASISFANGGALANHAGRQQRQNDRKRDVMKALILYVAFVTIGALIAVGVGLYVESAVSSAASLVVFLILFFANFAVSWIAVILVMDGTLKDGQGRQAQIETERAGRARMTVRG
jgi:hypothetical protein